MTQWVVGVACGCLLILGGVNARATAALIQPALARESPRVVEARYQAVWLKDQLSGAAQLRIRNAGSGSAFLPLAPWNLALRSGARLGDQSALLGDHANLGFGLLLNQPGEHQLSFDWSVRVERRPEGWSVFLQTPATPLAVLELWLPADLLLECPGARQLLPIAGPAALGVRRWQVAFGGASSQDLELLLRPAAAQDTVALVLTRLACEHEILPSGVGSRFELDLDVLRGKVQELTLELDARLEPVQAFLRQTPENLLTWKLQALPGRKLLRLALPEGLDKRCSLELHCRLAMPLDPSSARWSAPLIRVPGALGGRASLRLRTPTDLALTDWEWGDFQPAEAPTLERRGGLSTEVVVLKQVGPEPKSGWRGPSAKVQRPTADFSARQEAWWHVSAKSPTLVVRSTLQVLAGKVHEVGLGIPAGWQVVDVEFPASGPTASHTTRQREPGSLLTVQFKEPLTPNTTNSLTVRLRPADSGDDFVGPTVLAVPHLSVEGARWQQTTLAVSLERGLVGRQPLYKALLRHLTAGTAPPPSFAQPGLVALPELFLTYHGSPVDARLEITPLEPQTQARVRTVVALGRSARTVIHELEVRPIRGRPTQVSFFMGGADLGWRWEVRGATRRIVEERRSPATHVQQAGTRIDLFFDQPLDEPFFVSATTSLPEATEFLIPLVQPLEESGVGGRLILHLEPGLAAALPAEELEAVSEPGGSHPWPVYRAFAYGSGRAVVKVRLESGGSAAPAQPFVSAATHVAQVEPSGKIAVRYAARIENSEGAPLTLHLPAQAKLRTLRLNGRVMNLTVANGRVGVPGRTGRSMCEVEYEVSVPVSRWLPRVELELPTWDEALQVDVTRRFWCLPQQCLPLDGGLALYSGPAPGSWLTPSLRALSWQTLAMQRHDLAGAKVATASAELDSATEAALLPPGFDRGWQVWEVVAASNGPLQLSCVQQDYVWLASALLLALTPLCVWLFLRYPGLERHAVGLGLCGMLGLSWLPAALSPLAWSALLIAAASPVLRKALQAPGGPLRNKPSRASRAVAVILPLVVCSFLGEAAALHATAVPILADTQQPPSAYVVLSADYAATVEGEQVRLQARFEVHVHGPEPVDLELPLQKVRLIRASLDGETTLARVLPAQRGVGLRVAAAGRHVIQLDGHVAIEVQGPQRILRCTIPEVSASKLRLEMPGSAQVVRLVGVRGCQQQQTSGTMTAVEADLGRTPELWVRWWPQGDLRPPVRMREHYLWDLRPGEFLLRALLECEAPQAPVSALRFRLPVGLELKSAEILQATPLLPAPRLRSLRVEGDKDQRVLVMELENPLVGECRVRLDLDLYSARDAANPAKLRLPVPEPLQDQRGAVLVGLRLEEFRLGSLEPGAGLVELKQLDAANGWPMTLCPPEQLHRIYRWQGSSGPVIACEVRSATPVLHAHQTTVLTLDGSGAEFKSLIDVRLAEAPCVFLEWDTSPQLTLFSLQGDDVQRWTHAGQRLQVWLKRPVNQATAIQLRGGLHGLPAVAGQHRAPAPRLALRGALVEVNHLEVRQRGTGQVTLEKQRHLETLPGPHRDPGCVGVWFTRAIDFEAFFSYPVAAVESAPAVQAAAWPKDTATLPEPSAPDVQAVADGAAAQARLSAWLPGSRDREEASHAALATTVLAGLLALLCWIDLARGHRSVRLRRLWPEACLALGLLWVWWPCWPVALALMATGLGARGLWLGRWLFGSGATPAAAARDAAGPAVG